MQNKSNRSPSDGVDFFLDITDLICPMTFVKTRLLIDRMAPGQTAEILLTGGEPLANVPRSIEEHGHSVLSLVPEGDAHRLRIRKAG